MINTRMNPEIKAQWLRDLRSGNYLQGELKLTSVHQDGTQRHCCLGLLCKQAVAAGITTEVQSFTEYGAQAIRYGTGVEASTNTVGHFYYLPEAVSNWAGISRYDITAGYNQVQSQLTTMNDSGMPFAGIADWIEEYL